MEIGREKIVVVVLEGFRIIYNFYICVINFVEFIDLLLWLIEKFMWMWIYFFKRVFVIFCIYLEVEGRVIYFWLLL